MKANYQKTMIACFIGYIVQAVINNFIPLLFLTFQKEYAIPISRITVLISVNFVVQLAVDVLAARFVDRIGYRVSVLAAHWFSACGLFLLAVLPERMDSFTGILISVVIYAIGGGLIEVLISPIMESCPTENKEAAMSLLHSFYCWGHVGVVLLSSLFFRFAGVEHWKLLACIWAMLPVLNFVLFLKAPLTPLVPEGARGMTIKDLLCSRLFWVLFLMMFCAGAGEQALVQWSSAFAEGALGVSKTVGDLAGPMSFAVFMGLARAVYGKNGRGIDLQRFIQGSCVLCAIAYLLAGLAPWPALSLMACAVCGLSVGILWPGTYSTAARLLQNGGTAMFALLAVSGDLGCAAGPALVGWITAAGGGDMRRGILAAAVFPVVLLVLTARGNSK